MNLLLSSLLLASLPQTHTILCRNTEKAWDFLCFTLRWVSRRYKIWGVHSIKTKTRVTSWLSHNLPSGLCTFPATHGGAACAIRQKAAFTPSLSRKDRAGNSFCHGSSYTNKSGLEHSVWKERCPLRLPGSPLELLALPEHVESEFQVTRDFVFDA